MNIPIITLLYVACLIPWRGQTNFIEKASINGFVTKVESGTPLWGVRILIANVMDSRAVALVSTDQRGRFEIKGLEPGEYQLAAQLAGFVSSEYSVNARDHARAIVSLHSGQNQTVSIEMMTASVISGRVLDQLGQPVISAIVEAESHSYVKGRLTLDVLRTSDETGIHVNQAITDDLGEFRLHSLPAGEFFLKVRRRDVAKTLPTIANYRNAVSSFTLTDQQYAPMYYPGVTDPSDASSVRVTPGSEIRGIEFKLHDVRASAIRGRLLLADPRRSLIGAPEFIIVRTGSGQIVGVQSRLSGDAYELRSIRQGSYEITVVLREGSKTMIGRAQADLDTQDIENLDIVLRPPVEVLGHVSNVPPGLMHNQLQIRLDSAVPSRLPIQLKTGLSDTGAFRFENVPVSEYLISVSGVAGAYVEKASVGAQDILGASFVPSVDASQMLSLEIGVASGGITGRVIDNEGQAVPSATVTLLPEYALRRRLDRYVLVSTDAIGGFHIEKLAPGNYLAYAWDQMDDEAYMNGSFLRTFQDRGVLVKVEPDKVSRLTLRLIRSFQVH